MKYCSRYLFPFITNYIFNNFAVPKTPSPLAHFHICVSKQARKVKVEYRLQSKEKVTYLVINSADLKVFGKASERSENMVMTSDRSGTNYIWRWTQRPTTSWQPKPRWKMFMIQVAHMAPTTTINW